MKLDQLDRALLDALQNTLPLSCQPFGDLAARLKTSEEEVLARIAALKETGLIRRIGGIMNSKQLGYTSALCAMTVPEERIDEVAAILNQLSGVTHNYVRDHHYNLWFTLTSPSQAALIQQLKALEQACGLSILPMPARKLYKIKVSFDMGAES
ncbi:MAG TPA: AsnC family transcriptional regulator [Syntrophomonas sp.]|nr:AsnC family transcriptional regulator [Syntrophomonas sp.]HRW11560.1 AsnC family transcriptional regulator [Syntrophomonas sp.]